MVCWLESMHCAKNAGPTTDVQIAQWWGLLHLDVSNRIRVKSLWVYGPKIWGGWTATICHNHHISSWIPQLIPAILGTAKGQDSGLTIFDLLRHLFTSCFMGFSKQLKLARLCQNSPSEVGCFSTYSKFDSPEILHLPPEYFEDLWRWWDLYSQGSIQLVTAGISSAPWGGYELRKGGRFFWDQHVSHTAIGCGHATCLPGTIFIRAVCAYSRFHLNARNRSTIFYNHEHSWDSWEIIWDTFHHCICGYLHVGKMVMHELTW